MDIEKNNTCCALANCIKSSGGPQAARGPNVVRPDLTSKHRKWNKGSSPAEAVENWHQYSVSFYYQIVAL